MKFTRETRAAVALCALYFVLVLVNPPAHALTIYSDNDLYRTDKNGNGQELQYLPYDPEDEDTFGPDDEFYLRMEDMPSIVLRPDDSFMIRLHPNFNAVPIAPNYLIAARHPLPNNLTDGAWLGKDVYVGRSNQAQLEVVDVAIHRQDQELGPSLDLVVLKLGTIAGQSVTQLSTWANLESRRELSVPGQSVVVGGYGPQKKVFGNDVIPFVFGVSSIPKGNLAWALDAPGPANAPHHLAGFNDGDSGSGHFIRSGWGWNVADIEASGYGDVSAFDFILSSIRDMENDENYVIPTYQAPLPSPTNEWTGSASSTWSNAANWSSTFVPAGTDIVRVALPTQPADVTSGVDVAGDLYIGAEGDAGTVNVHGTASLDVVRSIYVGPEVADSGLLTVYENATVNVANIYVGVYGQGAYVQTAGTTNVDGIFYVGNAGGSDGTAVIATTGGAPAEFNAASIFVGNNPNSIGDLSIGRYAGSNQPDVTAQWLVVGNHGNGTLHQVAESTITVDRLLIGYQTDSQGTYELTGNGELNTGETSIGSTGNGTFYQSAGTHDTDQLTIGENGAYTLDGGTNNASYLNIDDGGSYILDGGILNVTKGITAQGTIDFGGGELILIGVADLTAATLVDPDEADLTVSDFGLLILPVNFDIETEMPGLSVDSTSTAHVEGNGPLVIEDGHGVQDHGAPVTVIIRDDVILQGDAFFQITEGQAVRLRGNLTIEDDGIAVLGTPTGEAAQMFIDDLFSQPGRDVTLDLNNGSLQVYQLLAKEGYTLTANGMITTTELEVSPGASLEIGPDTDELTLDGQLTLHTGSTLKMDIGGLTSGENDYITITNETFENAFDGNLELSFVDDFLPLPGDEIELISYTLRTSHVEIISIDPPVFEIVYSEFADITHNGPAGLNAIPVFSSDTFGVFSIQFSALAGDADLDGDIDGDDYVIVIQNFDTTGNWSDGDFDGDGDIDGDDIITVQTNGSGFSWADFNNDGEVDDADFSFFTGVWNNTYDPYGGPGDFNHDGIVYDEDLSFFVSQWTGSGGGAFIPEPASLSLLTLVASSLALRRRR